MTIALSILIAVTLVAFGFILNKYLTEKKVNAELRDELDRTEMFYLGLIENDKKISADELRKAHGLIELLVEEMPDVDTRTITRSKARALFVQ